MHGLRLQGDPEARQDTLHATLLQIYVPVYVAQNQPGCNLRPPGLQGPDRGTWGADRIIYCVDRASYPALCLAMAWEDPPPFGETRPNRRGRLDSQSTAPAKRSIITRLGKQHARPPPSPEKPVEEPVSEPQPLSPSYRIPWTAEALLQKTHDCRHALGAGLKAHMTLVREALSQDRECTPEQEFKLHAELEIMRQAYDRLSRD